MASTMTNRAALSVMKAYNDVTKDGRNLCEFSDAELDAHLVDVTNTIKEFVKRSKTSPELHLTFASLVDFLIAKDVDIVRDGGRKAVVAVTDHPVMLRYMDAIAINFGF